MADNFSEMIAGIFDQNDKAIKKELKKPVIKGKQIQKRELELAVAVLLVDLASSDQNFDMSEYNTIAAGLRRIFGTTLDEVQALVNQANLVLANLRGTSRFANLLKQNLSLEERQLVMEVIDEVVCADGVEDGYETYLRHKFADLLGVEARELGIEKKTG